MKVHPLLKALSNETNLQILTLLGSGSFHPRELARLLQRDETDVSRRLKQLEKLGLVAGRWVRVGDRNVRVYSLRTGEIRVELKPGEIRVRAGEEEFDETLLRPKRVPPVENFVGRREELDLLLGSKGVVVIYGMAGIGKTFLAARAFPSACWYSFTGLEDFYYLTWQFGLFLNSLGWGELTEYLRGGGRSEADVFELITEGLEATRGTVVLDDLHKCEDERVLRMLTYLAPRLREGRIVVTTRVKPNLGADGVTYLELRGLKPEEAYELVRMKGEKMDPEEFAGLYGLTLGHPLALNLLLEGQIREKRQENLFDFLFGEVYKELGEDERLMLSILALFDEPVEYEAIKALYRKKNAFSVLYSLLRRGLIERKGDGYSIHELLRGFLREVSNLESAQYYGAYSDYLAEKETPADFLRAMKYAIASGDRERVRKLVAFRITKMKLVITDFPTAYLRILSPLSEEPAVKLEMGMVYFQKGLYEKAKKLWLEAEPVLEGVFKAEVESLLADLSMELGDMGSAGEYLEKTRKLAEELKDLYTWLSYYMEKTKYDYRRGDVEGALESAFKELEIVRELKDVQEEPLILLHIGDIYAGMESYERAVTYYGEALELSKAYGIRFLEHATYMELAKAYYGLKNYGKAVEYATKAAEYFLKLRNYRRAADSIAYRCVSYLALGELEKARTDAWELVRIAESTNYPLGWAGYLFLGAAERLEGREGEEYFGRGREKLRGNERLYDAVLGELEKILTSKVNKVPPEHL
ncbi:helix-turn-helix domain-containing protein [Thermococcus zilligii]|uniref:helix-turn-helix domain-containing protein n=1 Tax=Thermococcus zilligii TaxID=54076 RepID=UPI0005927DBA|nr:helix-turn-helix domain-containing protein [Thermococcus zilligii]